MIYPYDIRNDDKAAERVGNRIAEMLSLKKNPGGYFTTTFGPKTAIELAQTISDIYEAEMVE